MAIEFHDYSVNVKTALNDSIIAFLYEASGEIQSHVTRNSRVRTGQLKGSWKVNVDEAEGIAMIGSALQNAIWEEFGTGQYALNGNGRITPWSYEDEKGNWHRTRGKKPQRTLHNAFIANKNKIKSRLEEVLRGIN